MLQDQEWTHAKRGRRRDGNGSNGRRAIRERLRIGGSATHATDDDDKNHKYMNKKRERSNAGWSGGMYVLAGCMCMICALELLFVSQNHNNADGSLFGTLGASLPFTRAGTAAFMQKPWEKMTLSSWSMHGPPPPPPPPPPSFETNDEWKEVVDSATNSVYFYNARTGRTTWSRPEALGGTKKPAPPPPAPPVAAIPSDAAHPLPSAQRPASRPAVVEPSNARSVRDIDCDIEEGTDLLGGDIVPPSAGEQYDVLSAEDCCEACKGVAACWAFVYKSSTQVCYLKGSEANKTPAPSLVSGILTGRSPGAPGAPSRSTGDGVKSAQRVPDDDDDEIKVPEALRAVYPDPEAAAAGTFADVVDPEILRMSDEVARKRAEAVKASFKFMWDNYRQRAMGMDELKPRSGKGDNNWGSMGVTLVDALDTLWLMDLREDFEAAKQWVATRLDFSKVTQMMSFFETNIRMMGGLLSAYDLSQDRVFLEKAEDLGRRMLPGYRTSTGIPHAQISLGTGKTKNSWTGSNAVLSEFGTLQLEWRYLSHATGKPEYRRVAEKIYDAMGRATMDGMWPTLVNRNNGHPSGSVYTFGALSDSFYEYLLKVWLQGRKTEPRYRDMYDESISGLTKHLLGQSGHLKFVGEKRGGRFQRKMEHLTCFVGGMLALGAVNDPRGANSARAARDMKNAKSVAYTCYRMYRDMVTGLSPEFVTFDGNGHIHPGSTKYYILRPEAAETMFVLHQLTGHPVFRQWGWDMFTAIRRKCKTTYGFGNYPDVSKNDMRPDDRAESFFMAETLKYLYLLQLPAGEGSGGVPLDEYVFNTEAHPLRIFPDTWRAV